MELLLAFSVLKNSKALFSLESSRDDIESIHGIRAVNAFMLLVSHKSMAMFYNPYTNRTAMTEVRSNFKIFNLYDTTYLLIT